MQMCAGRLGRIISDDAMEYLEDYLSMIEDKFNIDLKEITVDDMDKPIFSAIAMRYCPKCLKLIFF